MHNTHRTFRIIRGLRPEVARPRAGVPRTRPSVGRVDPPQKGNFAKHTKLRIFLERERVDVCVCLPRSWYGDCRAGDRVSQACRVMVIHRRPPHVVQEGPPGLHQGWVLDFESVASVGHRWEDSALHREHAARGPPPAPPVSRCGAPGNSASWTTTYPRVVVRVRPRCW